MTIDAITDLSAFEAELALEGALSEGALEQLFHGAHTPTEFADTPVPEALVRRVFELVKWAPTALNTQPLRVVLAQSPEARERLVADMNEGNRPKTLGAPVVAVAAADLRFHEELPRVAPHAAQAAIGFEADATSRERVATYNSALQTAYLILAIRALGLDAAPMGGFDAGAVARDFFSDGHHRPQLVIAFGYAAPDAFRPRLPRLGYDEVVQTV